MQPPECAPQNAFLKLAQNRQGNLFVGVSFKKVAGMSTVTLLKKTPSQVFSFALRNFKEHLLCRTSAKGCFMSVTCWFINYHRSRLMTYGFNVSFNNMWSVRKEHGRQGCIEYTNVEHTNLYRVVISKRIHQFS